MTMVLIVGVVVLAIVGIAAWLLLRQRKLEVQEGGQATSSSQGLPTGAIVGLVLVSFSATVGGLYAFLGSSGAGKGGSSGAANGSPHALGAQQIAAMTERLAAKLQQNPNDGESWLILARSYGALGRFSEAAGAYKRAISLLPPDAQVLADLADTMAMAQNRSLQGEPEKVVAQALQVDPNNVKALALAGTAAYDRQDYGAAVAKWRQLLALVPPGSPAAEGAQTNIADAESRLSASGKGGGGAQSSAAASKTVSGTVQLDPALAKSVSPNDAVFVFARAVDGPKVPLAMMRRTVADLPLQFSLDDSMAMAPNFRISQYPKVIVGARISKSGDALARSGDLEGFSSPVAPGEAQLKVLINTPNK